MSRDHGKGRSKLIVVLDWVVTIAVALLLTFLLRLYVGEPFVVPSGSMLETIQLDDRFWGEKISYHFREPERGDIVTFMNPDGSDKVLVKRVIATEGQTVDLIDGYVYVDGERLDEPYTLGKPSDPLIKQMPGIEPITYPLTVPEGCVWVMGDNRTNSADSRYFGPVEKSTITSRAMFTFWPLSDARVL